MPDIYKQLRESNMRIEGPTANVSDACEDVLCSLPAWFGIEAAIQEYVKATTRFPTFVALIQEKITGFVSVQRHFEQSWEVHCIAVHADARGLGIGSRLLSHAERWMAAQGALYFQVKTLAQSHPSTEYAETRAFYARRGYVPLQVFPDLWSPGTPCLQMIKLVEFGQ